MGSRRQRQADIVADIREVQQSIVIIHVPPTTRETTIRRPPFPLSVSRAALSSHRALLVIGVAIGLLGLSTRARAQGPSRIDAGGALEVGSEAERYWRLLQLAGYARFQPWSIRPIAPPDHRGLVADSVHPWMSRWGSDSTARLTTFRLLRPGAKLTFNSAFPSGDNRGPAWTGRGATGELRAGATATFWRIRLQLEPVLFLAQNANFVLVPNGITGDRSHADARFPNRIDAPQRFGDKAYGRLDGGNSTLSLDLPWISAGVSTRAQSWGPAREYPLLLSGSSGGFAHGFVGTRKPLNIGFARVHAAVIAGHLEQSPYSPAEPDRSDRWASGGTLLLMPRGLPGLELGVARFVQGPTTTTFPTMREVRRLFSAGLRATGENNFSDENQVASISVRWHPPGAALEVYGEYFREDYSLGLRRLLQYPDDLRSFTLGLQRVFAHSPERLRSFRFELVNAELSSSNRGERGDIIERKLRAPFPPYLHGSVLQGHTNRGLFLGSPEAYGGAAWRAGFDQYDARGRTSLTLERALRLDWSPVVVTPDGIAPPDVLVALTGDAMRFVGTREMGLSLSAMLNLNRNLQRGNDVPNLRATLSIRGFR